MQLILVGLNHETAPVELREKIKFTNSESSKALAELRKNPAISEALILSTCNRTEAYIRCNSEFDISKDSLASSIITKLIDSKSPGHLDEKYFYTMLDEDAALHLFRVSAGLESQIKGEAQILAQVKESYRQACDEGSCGYFLHKLFHQAFHVGKRSRTETVIGIGAVSISLAVVALAEDELGSLAGKKAVVIGAGETASLAAEYLVGKTPASLTIVNRTFEKTQELACRLNANPMPLENILDALSDADLGIASTSAGKFLISENDIRLLMQSRPDRPLLLIDISVPRNIDPCAANVRGVTCYDIDDLKAVVDKNLDRRNGEIPKVEKIIEKEMETFMQWQNKMEVTPTIKDLFDQIESMRAEEVKRRSKHFTPEQLEQVDLLTKCLVKKILHHPIQMLKNGGQSEIPGSQSTAETVRNVFNLGQRPHA